MDKQFKNPRRKTSRLSTKAKIIIAVILVIYAVIMIAVGFIVFYKPSVSHEVPFNVPETDAQGRTVEHKFEPKADTYNFLILGRDKSAYLTDVIMLVNLNTADNSVTVMQIPRDTYVAGGYPSNRMNAVYSTIYSRMRAKSGNDKESAQFALEEVTKLIEQSFCINIHYSMIMNLEGFKNIVDIIGGVDVEVPFHLYYNDPDQGLYIDIPAGYQHLNGAQAEGFVRYRDGYAAADMARQDAQKKFLFAMFSKLKSSFKITELNTLTQVANEVFDNLLTDMSAADMLFFAKNLLGIDAGNIRMLTIPGNLPYNSYYRTQFFVINKAGAIHVINEYFNAYSTKITDYMFDQNQIFNEFSGTYEAPMENANYGIVYDDGDEIKIVN